MYPFRRFSLTNSSSKVCSLGDSGYTLQLRLMRNEEIVLYGTGFALALVTELRPVGITLKLSLLLTYVYIITGKYFTYLRNPVLGLGWASVGSPLWGPCCIQTNCMQSTYYTLSDYYMGVTSTIVATNDTEFIDNNTSIYSSQETRTNKLLEGFSLRFLVIKRPNE